MNTLAAVARGSRPADLVIRGARVANVFTLEYEEADVAVCGDRIAGVGRGYEGHRVLDAAGAVLVPGLIDGHVHIESSLMAPAAFADAVTVHGTTTVMADPHEIANALGLPGVRYMYLASRGLAVDVFLGAPSCVPASRFETPRDELDMMAVREMLQEGWCTHLGEMMNYPALIEGDPDVWGKVAAAGDVVLTGHAPGVLGKDLNAYLTSGVSSAHECVGLDEAREKLRRGMWVMMREGASFPNLRALLPLLKENPLLAARCMVVTDDATARYIRDTGHMDAKLRIMIEEGVDPLVALRMTTLSPADYFRLWDRGGIAPGRRADLVLVDDLASFNVKHVWKDGRAVVQDGVAVKGAQARSIPLPHAAQTTPLTEEQLRVPAEGETMNVIEMRPGEIITGALQMTPLVSEGNAVPDPSRDLAKIVVLERHHGTGRFAVGFVTGFGMQRGAIASSVAHDAHNFVAAGMDDRSIVTALGRLCETGGGLVLAEGGSVRGSLPLPIGGLMTHLDAESVARALEDLERGAEQLGVQLPHPFMALSFLCLSVVPNLRITDQGYVDIMRGGVQPLFPEGGRAPQQGDATAVPNSIS